VRRPLARRARSARMSKLCMCIKVGHHQEEDEVWKAGANGKRYSLLGLPPSRDVCGRHAQPSIDTYMAHPFFNQMPRRWARWPIHLSNYAATAAFLPWRNGECDDPDGGCFGLFLSKLQEHSFTPVYVWSSATLRASSRPAVGRLTGLTYGSPYGQGGRLPSMLGRL
jgi:hypothetical protein